MLGQSSASGEPLTLIEADVNEGVRAVPLSEYWDMHTRICRPVGLSPRNLEWADTLSLEALDLDGPHIPA